MTKPNFGFTDIQPIVEADRVADRLGFTSREAPPERKRRRQPVDEVQDQLNIRASRADINRFIEFCDHHRFSYREGLAELLRRASD
jgi:hypothetical protein